jgi:hypothetical protein
MLAALLNVPHVNDDWSHFSWDHRDSHDRIRAAIKAQFGTDLTDYQIEPMNPTDTQDFLNNNAQLHNDMNSVLGLQGTNLEVVDLTQDNEKASWINLHYLEHYYAEQKLGI